MKIVLFLLIIIHGLIHILGFIKAFGFSEVSQLTNAISKPYGILWFITAGLFILSSVVFIARNDHWWIFAVPALLVSQILIIIYWGDAKFGTIANLIILFPVLIALMNSMPFSFKNVFKMETEKRIKASYEIQPITESDIIHLPGPVQKYLRYSGVIGKPKVINFRAEFSGRIKTKQDGKWLDFHSRQYNFFNDPARLFLMESGLFGIPFDGFHIYTGSNATMQIKIASTFRIVDAKGEKMNKGETVTMFNDMCIMAPATLIDSSIKWELIDSLTVKGHFTNKENTITASLFFNEKGELVNFISHDRFLSTDGIEYLNYPWSTPLKNYKEIDGSKIATYGNTIWQTPNGEFIYGEFDLINIEYNCKSYK